LEASLGKTFERPYLEKPFTKIGLVEWLKVKALSSSLSTIKKRERERTGDQEVLACRQSESNSCSYYI
jgi:hypothetical protein